MRISFSWLKKYVPLADSVTAEEVAEALKLSTVEVEEVEHSGASLVGVVVGRVVSIEKHPKADRLQVCQVSIGKETLQVVCGGSNVREGMDVAFAGVGVSVRWHGEGDPIVLEKTTIRGVDSYGMICASDEIGLLGRFPKKDEKEIVDLTEYHFASGTALAEALCMDDAVFVIDNKSLSHRSDLWGHYGIAREVAALFRRDVVPLDAPKIAETKGSGVRVSFVQESGVRRYMAVTIEGVSAMPSPDWLVSALSSVGIASKNILVDATNYVMHDIGQPLHAFDADAISEKGISVRFAHEGESFVSLLEKTYSLSPEMLVIADGEKVLALAGVIGGKDSAVSEKTTRVVIESATFDALLVRRASRALSLRTDASARFEKTLDPELAATGLFRVVSLILSVCKEARVVGKVYDSNPKSAALPSIAVPHAFLESILGTTFAKKDIISPLERLGFVCKKDVKGVYTFIVPSWRAAKDISTKEDIAEEVLRMHGFSAIKSVLPEASIVPPPVSPLLRLVDSISDSFSLEFGCTEVSLYSFVSFEDIIRLGDNPETYLSLANPLAKDRPFLRRSLLPNMLVCLERALREEKNIALFEIGKTYISDEAGERSAPGSDELLPRQDTVLLSVSAGEETSFASALHMAVSTARRSGYELCVVRDTGMYSYAHPGRSAILLSGDKTVGRVYELHPRVQEAFGFSVRVFCVEMNLSILSNGLQLVSNYEPLSLYPVVERDISFVVDNLVSHESLVQCMFDAHPLVKDVKLFDVITGKGIVEGKKSMAYRLFLSDKNKTLSAEEVDSAISKIEEVLQKAYTVFMRT